MVLSSKRGEKALFLNLKVSLHLDSTNSVQRFAFKDLIILCKLSLGSDIRRKLKAVPLNKSESGSMDD